MSVLNVSFLDWVESVECVNVQANRYVNYATYPLPIKGLSLVEREHSPFNVFLSTTRKVFIEGLVMDYTDDNVRLLANHFGLLMPDVYSEDKYFCQFDDLESAYFFLLNEYDNIIKSFQDSLIKTPIS